MLNDVGNEGNENQSDNSQIASSIEKEKSMFVPSLAVAGFAASIPALMLTILTVDMASTFHVSVGVAAQLSTVNSTAQVVFALLMGVLAVRFNHKSLLLIGSLFVVASAIIGFFAPTLVLMQTVFVFVGGGSVMVGIMSLTLVGEFLPSHRKAKAVSYLFAIGSLASLVGNIVIGFLTNVGGWRSVFLLLVLPVSVAGLVLSFLSLPSKPAEPRNPVPKEGYVTSFKQVFSNRSAISCLVGGIVAAAGVGSFGIFAIAFYREHFLVSRDFTVAVMLAVSSVFIVAALVVGRLVNRVGAKNLAVGSLLLSGVFSVAFFLAPNLWVALGLNVIQAWFFAAGGTAYSCLILDQVPHSRGTMMSLNTVCGGVGGAIGVAIGGTLLVLISYQAVGFAIAAFCFVATAIYYFLTKDPSRR